MSSSFDPVLVSAFTQDPVAESDTLCQSSTCHAVVRKGEPYIYVGRKDHKGGRRVCAACYEWYRSKPESITVSRDAFVSLPRGHTDDIRHSVNAARAKGTTNPPRVVPINQGNPWNDGYPIPVDWNNCYPMPALPPPPPLGRPQLRHPPAVQPQNVRVPTAPWEAAGDQTNRALIPPIAIGYNANHQVYLAERDRKAHAVYGRPPSQSITLSILAVFDSGKSTGRSRGTPIGNICKGVRDINARITAPDLRDLAVKTIEPCLISFCRDFPWRTKEFVVRDENWVNLATYSPPNAPYFYHSCLKENPKKNANAPIFRTKTFTLKVVVPHDQWLDYQDFQNRIVSELSSTIPGPSRRRCSSSPHPTISNEGFRHERSLSPVHTHNALAPSVAKLRHPRASPEPSFGPLFMPALTNKEAEAQSSDGLVQGNAEVRSKALSIKRTRQHSGSVSSVTAKSPPSKRTAPALSPLDVPSPDKQDIKEALRSGGMGSLNVELILKQTTQLIDFYPIPTLAFREIVKPEHHSFNIGTTELISGQIRVESNPRSLIGVGAFKTAQTAQLVLSNRPSTGLGSKVGQTVVVAKQPYNRRETQGAVPPFARFAIADELEKLGREANVLYWAKALLDMTYSFVDNSLMRSTEKPPFSIPRLQFVEAGLALGYTTTAGGPRSVNRKAGTVSVAYLIEELIPNIDSFVKFIHNGTCQPISNLSDSERDVAEFLAFTQHVQYDKTGGLAYISDYQGSPPFLTDPQILTHPSVGQGRNIFCEGNLEKGVEEFKTQHICNAYCKWPGFKLTEFSSNVATRASASALPPQGGTSRVTAIVIDDANDS